MTDTLISLSLLTASLSVLFFSAGYFESSIQLRASFRPIEWSSIAAFQVIAWLLVTAGGFKLTLARDAVFSIMMIVMFSQCFYLYLFGGESKQGSDVPSLYPFIFAAFVLFGFSKSFDVIPVSAHKYWLVLVCFMSLITTSWYLLFIDPAANGNGNKAAPVNLSSFLSIALFFLALPILYLLAYVQLEYSPSTNSNVFIVIGLMPFLIFAIKKFKHSRHVKEVFVMKDTLLITAGISFPIFLLVSKLVFDKSYFIGFSEYQFWALFFSFLITFLNIIKPPKTGVALLSSLFIMFFYLVVMLFI